MERGAVVYPEMGQSLSKRRGVAGLWRYKLLGHETNCGLEMVFTMNPSGLFAKGLFCWVTHSVLYRR